MSPMLSGCEYPILSGCDISAESNTAAKVANRKAKCSWATLATNWNFAQRNVMLQRWRIHVAIRLIRYSIENKNENSSLAKQINRCAAYQTGNICLLLCTFEIVIDTPNVCKINSWDTSHWLHISLNTISYFGIIWSTQQQILNTFLIRAYLMYVTHVWILSICS